MAWRLLIGAIMHALAAIVSEHVWGTLPAWPMPFVHTAQLAAGMSIVALAFAVAQLLLFFEELWWRP